MKRKAFKNTNHFDHFLLLCFFSYFLLRIFIYEIIQELKSKSILYLHRYLFNLFFALFDWIMDWFLSSQSCQNIAIFCVDLHFNWLCQKQEYLENIDWSHLRSHRRYRLTIWRVRSVQCWCLFIFDWASTLQYINNWMLENDRLANFPQQESLVLPQLCNPVLPHRHQPDNHFRPWPAIAQSDPPSYLPGLLNSDLHQQYFPFVWKQKHIKRPDLIGIGNNKFLHIRQCSR